jgi:molybdate transport system substrate-binding protein
MTRRSIALAVAGIVILLASGLGAQTPPIRILASNAVKAVLEDLRPQAERTVGRPLDVEFGLVAVLNERVRAGAPFDVAIFTTEATDNLIKEGKLVAGTRTDFGRVGVGLGIRAGAPKPDIGTPEAIKQALLNARSIAYAPNGASTVYTTRMLERLGIAEAMKPKTVLQASDLSTAAVAQGRTDFVITLMSEIVPVPGVELLGPLPPEFQGYVGFAAGVNTAARDAQAARALLQFLVGPAGAPVFRAKGLELR